MLDVAEAKKRKKRIENFEIQALKEIVKTNGEDVVENFEQKFKEIRVEGKRKSHNSSSTLYTDKLPSTYYTEAEQREIEAMYMGTESEARKRFNNSHSQSRTQVQSQDGRARSFSRPRYDPSPRYNDPRSRLDRFKSPGGRQPESAQCDQSRTQSRTPYPPPF